MEHGESKSICRSIVYIDEAIEVLVPEHRRGHPYARSFSADHPLFKTKTWQECFAMIEKCTIPVEVADLMNYESERNYAWNFRNLIYGGKMTIEFRRGPGVTCAEDCLAWTELVVAFTQSLQCLGH